MVSRRAFLSLVAGSMSASRFALAPQEACKVALYANVVSDLTHSRWHGYCNTPPRSCSSQALPPWRTCARISPLPTSSCRPTRSTNSTGSALADVGCDSMSVNCPL